MNIDLSQCTVSLARFSDVIYDHKPDGTYWLYLAGDDAPTTFAGTAPTTQAANRMRAELMRMMRAACTLTSRS